MKFFAAAYWYQASSWGVPFNHLLFAWTVLNLEEYTFCTLVFASWWGIWAEVWNTCLPGVYFWLYTRLFFITCAKDGSGRERAKDIQRKLERMKASQKKMYKKGPGRENAKESWKGWKPHQTSPRDHSASVLLCFCKEGTLSTRVLISYLYLGNLIFLPWDFCLSLLTGFALLEIFPVFLLRWHHSASLPVRSTLSYHIWSTIEIWTFREDPRIQALKRNLLAVYSSSVKCINLNFNMGR